jgi:hypothetical protein
LRIAQKNDALPVAGNADRIIDHVLFVVGAKAAQLLRRGVDIKRSSSHRDGRGDDLWLLDTRNGSSSPGFYPEEKSRK